MKPITHPTVPTEHSAELICDYCKKEELLTSVLASLEYQDEIIQRVRELSFELRGRNGQYSSTIISEWIWEALEGNRCKHDLKYTTDDLDHSVDVCIKCNNIKHHNHKHHWHIDTGNLQHCCECNAERITDKDPIED